MLNTLFHRHANLLRSSVSFSICKRRFRNNFFIWVGNWKIRENCLISVRQYSQEPLKASISEFKGENDLEKLQGWVEVFIERSSQAIQKDDIPLSIEYALKKLVRDYIKQKDPPIGEDSSNDFLDIFESKDDLDVERCISWISLQFDGARNQSIEKQRINTKRYNLSTLSYSQFLKQLYPLKENIGPTKYKIDFRKLFDSYLLLPSPRPLYIKSYHFEKLLKTLLHSVNEENFFLLKFWEVIIEDMRSCNLPLTTNNKNKVLQLLFHSENNINWDNLNLDTIEKLEKSLQLNDISSYNIILKACLMNKNTSSVSNNNYYDELITIILRKINTKRLKPNKATYVFLINYLSSINSIDHLAQILYHILDKTNISFDIHILNDILIALLKCGLFESSTLLLNHIIDITYLKINKGGTLEYLQRNKIRAIHKKNLKIIDFINQELDNKDIIWPYLINPVDRTFDIYIRNYIANKEFFEKFEVILKYLQFMMDQNIFIDKGTFETLYEFFINNHERDINSLNFANLMKLTDLLVNSNKKRQMFVTDTSISKTFQAFKMYSPHSEFTSFIEEKEIQIFGLIKKANNSQKAVDIHDVFYARDQMYFRTLEIVVNTNK
ncbi:hypothetical protein PACTADRAFT_4450 [Pachysolen tannophilus NRRL Y-2460]|uniref:ATPase expression protein 2, mitochondrial n=1 Tax=Pachysolen tannophilus NRRL Y-2460 TaxID=669874 RepID=A0A1E4TRY0_PACTA|nr:hypothetical protein PACTADRAFT_4450 [Pachysolen tannophilus NRRL Y-2460]